jgi:hypothetical protein
MRKIAGPGNVANAFVDYDAVNNPQGTVVTSNFMNDVQDELIAIQTDASVAESAGSNAQILKLIKFNAIKYSKNIGEFFYIEENKSPSAFVLATPDNFFPAINLSKININLDISTTNYPLLVPYLRALKVKYLDGTSGEVSSFTATVASSSITMPTSTSSDAILSSLAEDVLVHGGYTNYRSITVAGTEFPITNINTSTRVITVTGTPSAGSQTVEFYNYRITGSSTTARLFEVKGRGFIAPNDSSGRHQNGLRVRDRYQGHWFADSTNTTLQLRSYTGNPSGSVVTDPPQADARFSTAAANGGNNKSIVHIDDTINGTPRTGLTTHGAGVSAHLYIWARSYIA